MYRAYIFSFLVGMYPALFGVYIDSCYWWIIVFVTYVIGHYIDKKYFNCPDDMFVKCNKDD